jgi:hypothetical protein
MRKCSFSSAKRCRGLPVDELIAETRLTYDGPLEVGEDLMRFEIGQEVSVRRFTSPAQTWAQQVVAPTPMSPSGPNAKWRRFDVPSARE